MLTDEARVKADTVFTAGINSTILIKASAAEVLEPTTTIQVIPVSDSHSANGTLQCMVAQAAHVLVPTTNITVYDVNDNNDHILPDEADGIASQNPSVIMVAQAAQVLEPSTTISRISVARGFRICGDNVDKVIHRRHLRFDRCNIDVHYFNSYAVRNRIDISALSDKRPKLPLIIDSMSILPTSDDDNKLRTNMSILVSRILCKHMKFFKVCFADIAIWHIKHKYSAEMSEKSHVVSMIHWWSINLMHFNLFAGTIRNHSTK